MVQFQDASSWCYGGLQSGANGNYLWHGLQPSLEYSSFLYTNDTLQLRHQSKIHQCRDLCPCTITNYHHQFLVRFIPLHNDTGCGHTKVRCTRVNSCVHLPSQTFTKMLHYFERDVTKCDFWSHIANGRSIARHHGAWKVWPIRSAPSRAKYVEYWVRRRIEQSAQTRY